MFAVNGWFFWLYGRGLNDMNITKLLFTVGIVLIILSGIIYVITKTGIPLGRLPGDIYVEKESGSFYFPIATCILISVLISFLFYVFRR